MAAKRKLNPMERALAQADNIIAANNELERLSRPAVSSSAPVVTHADTYNDRRGQQHGTMGAVATGLAEMGMGKSAKAARVRAREKAIRPQKSRNSGNTI